MPKSEPSAIEYRLLEFVSEIKSSSIVSISDLEEYNKILINVYEKIKELRTSRDNWRNKYEALKYD